MPRRDEFEAPDAVILSNRISAAVARPGRSESARDEPVATDRINGGSGLCLARRECDAPQGVSQGVIAACGLARLVEMTQRLSILEAELSALPGDPPRVRSEAMFLAQLLRRASRDDFGPREEPVSEGELRVNQVDKRRDMSCNMPVPAICSVVAIRPDETSG